MQVKEIVSRKIPKYFRVSDNTVHQNLWDAAETVLKKTVSSSTNIRLTCLSLSGSSHGA